MKYKSGQTINLHDGYRLEIYYTYNDEIENIIYNIITLLRLEDIMLWLE